MSDCPYGASDCPKIEDLEKKVAGMERTMNRILYLLYMVAGVLLVEFGVVVI